MPVEIIDATGKLIQIKFEENLRRLIMSGSSRSQGKPSRAREKSGRSRFLRDSRDGSGTTTGAT